MIESLRVIDHCPLCAGTVRAPAAPALPNLYSEKLAELLGCTEAALLQTVANVCCEQCGLIYKSRWFASAQLTALFDGAVATHPKGWDVVSGRFSAESFARELEAYAAALAAQDSAQCARYQRALPSIIDSMSDLPEAQRDACLQAIAAGDIDTLRAHQPSLVPHFSNPAPFKRFSGFAVPALWDWLLAQVGPIARYAEVGCPLWGFLAQPAAVADKTLLMRDEVNYWGAGCQRAGVHCSDELQSHALVRPQRWADMADDSFDLIALMQYLDHVESPVALVEQASRASRALLLILDEPRADSPCAVQHFTAWPQRALDQLAVRLDLRVLADYPPIRDSGNVAALLVRA